jgi:hypothetical protein
MKKTLEHQRKLKTKVLKCKSVNTSEKTKVFKCYSVNTVFESYRVKALTQRYNALTLTKVILPRFGYNLACYHPTA